MRNRLVLLTAILASVISLVVLVLVVSLFVVGGYWRNYVKGPKEVMSKHSPNGDYNAFVLNSPSLDGPNQSLNIETIEREELLPVAQLTEDVDFIKDILWSDDSQYVMFWSKDYLTLVRMKDYTILKVFLGKPYVRVQDGNKYTFKEQESREVEGVRFNEKGILEYKFRNKDEIELVGFSDDLKQ